MMDIQTSAQEQSHFDNLTCPNFIVDEESASICPLLTPSPSETKLICTSPDFPANDKLLMTSPEFMGDPESVSMCPLLESSPSPQAFRHPLDPLSGLAFEERGMEAGLPGYMGLQEVRDSRSSSLPGSEDMKHVKRGSVANNFLESSSSSSSAIQDNPSCVQLLNHHYQQLNQEKKDLGAFITQDNGLTPCLDLGGHKIPADHCFVNWNWPVIRTSCFWSVLSLTVACLCIVIGMVASVPKRCYPQHQWYQGNVFYEIFPASFQDSNHDGLGDLRGVASRTEYFKKLNVTAIRLNSIFPAEHYPEGYEAVRNLTSIDYRLGGIEDLEYLISVLHGSNISLILDLPIYPLIKALGELKIPAGKTDAPIRKENIAEKITNAVHNHRSHRSTVNESDLSPARLLAEGKNEFNGRKSLMTPYIDGGISGLMKVTSEHIKAISMTTVEEALEFWFKLGVDGVYIKGLEHYVYDPHFLTELETWKKIKDSYKGEKPKMLMANYSVLLTCEDQHQKDHVMETFDLLDVYLEVSNGSDFMAAEINRLVSGQTFRDRSLSWLHWNIGSIETKRLAGRVKNNLGIILFQSLLPGTISIFYGDELGLTDTNDPYRDHIELKHRYQLAPMLWINDPTNFTPKIIMPWLPYGESDSDPIAGPHIIHNITEMRYTTPSVYMNSIVKDDLTLKNCAIRYVDDSIIIIERYFPRRNAYIAVYNADDVKDIQQDISSIYYGGEVIQDSDGNSGSYINFKQFSLKAGAAIVVKLDK